MASYFFLAHSNLVVCFFFWSPCETPQTEKISKPTGLQVTVIPVQRFFLIQDGLASLCFNFIEKLKQERFRFPRLVQTLHLVPGDSLRKLKVCHVSYSLQLCTFFCLFVGLKPCQTSAARILQGTVFSRRKEPTCVDLP